jgi:hypothetical protein
LKSRGTNLPRGLDASWEITAIVSSARELTVDDHRRRRVVDIKRPHLFATPMTL